MLLTVEDLRVSYGNIKALLGLNFQIDEKEIVCIIGANGAGKSTLFNLITDLVGGGSCPGDPLRPIGP